MIILLNKNEIEFLPIGIARINNLTIPIGTKIIKVNVDEDDLNYLVDAYIKDEK